jgi:hypothetical protein
MKCVRCRGLMVADHFLDMGSGYGEMWTMSWRCVNCGHVYDGVIKENRLARQEKACLSLTPVPDYQEEVIHLGAESFTRETAVPHLWRRKTAS